MPESRISQEYAEIVQTILGNESRISYMVVELVTSPPTNDLRAETVLYSTAADFSPNAA